VEDQAQLKAIQVHIFFCFICRYNSRWLTRQASIHLLNNRFWTMGHLPLNNTLGDRESDDAGYDSDLECDEAKWFAMHVCITLFHLWESTDFILVQNNVDVLHKRLVQKGKAPAKKAKLVHTRRVMMCGRH
jgi:hypothetical protein